MNERSVLPVPVLCRPCVMSGKAHWVEQSGLSGRNLNSINTSQRKFNTENIHYSWEIPFHYASQENPVNAYVGKIIFLGSQKET